MPKLCNYCGETRRLSCFHKKADTSDGLSNKCKQCCSTYEKTRNRNRTLEYQKHGPRSKPRSTIVYRVIYDPCDTFGYASEFTRVEIYDMLNAEYLAIGTRFIRNRDRTIHYITNKMALEKEA